MSKLYIEDQEFKNANFNLQDLVVAEYENCTFKSCLFSSVDLSGIEFVECEFVDCDFSTAKLVGTAFKDVVFINCKLLGLHFDDCNPFLLSFRFVGCVLNLSSFYKLKLKNSFFKNCNLNEVEFIETNLTKSLFENCDLSGAVFEQANLEHADFRTSHNYAINPNINRIKKAKFSVHGVVGLLDQYDIIVE